MDIPGEIGKFGMMDIPGEIEIVGMLEMLRMRERTALKAQAHAYT